MGSDLESGSQEGSQNLSKKNLLPEGGRGSESLGPAAEMDDVATPRSTDGLLGDVKRMAKEIEGRSRGSLG